MLLTCSEDDHLKFAAVTKDERVNWGSDWILEAGPRSEGPATYKGWYFDGMLSTRAAPAPRPASEGAAGGARELCPSQGNSEKDYRRPVAFPTRRASHLEPEPDRLRSLGGPVSPRAGASPGERWRWSGS